MAQVKYYYDTVTCNYKRIITSKWDVFFSFLGFLMVLFVMSVGILLGYTTYFDSPKEVQLKQENALLQFHYDQLREEVDKSCQVLAHLQDQDDRVYRVIFGAAPTPSTTRRADIGNTRPYQDLADKNKLIATTAQKVDQLKRQLYIQSKSYDELQKLAQEKEKILAAMPAIQPLSNRDLKRLSSGFGMRLHPVQKVTKMHAGVDFAAPRGTRIYATGDGVVSVVKTSQGGYGKWVEIQHGYGFSTRYGHMQTFNVKYGQKVKRGECIGYVGMTGTATAPHVHYEVLKNRKPINPVYYFFNGLDAVQYEKVVQLASRKNQSLS